MYKRQELEWTITSDNKNFILEVDKENPRIAYVTAPENPGENEKAELTVKVLSSGLEARCQLSISNITADVPKIDNVVSTPPMAVAYTHLDVYKRQLVFHVQTHHRGSCHDPDGAGKVGSCPACGGDPAGI